MLTHPAYWASGRRSFSGKLSVASLTAMPWSFVTELIEWRGPAPFVFAPMPEEMSAELKEAARGLMYWGQVPVTAIIGATEFDTAVWPRDGRFLVPIKAVVQRAERVDVGDAVSVRLDVREDQLRD
ncbi:hypothetical protein GCM10009674_30060 [Nesterenkonia xinjiangensis]